MQPQSDSSVQSLLAAGRMSKRLAEVLSSACVSDLGELSGYGKKRLFMLRGMGPASMAELEALMDDFGYSF